ncbi:hypothetical protein ILUMI_16801 [Ignelater luminosus]|uniref:Transposase n=1 Tax=Ignelater luminosus TaxID=2038154 RepID=A0A8K0CS83_IGNLU|nr:hypothetical protein ILUMI_16801 [Ignelater luminosus]
MKTCRKETTTEERNIIIRLKKNGQLVRQIAKVVDRSYSTVPQIIQRYFSIGSVENRKRTGRPATLNDQECRNVLSTVRKAPKLSALKLAAHVAQDLKKTVHAQNIRQVLWKDVKHGSGSVMLWGSMSGQRVEKLVFIDGIMNHKMYLGILKGNISPTVEKLQLGLSWIFQ